MGNSSDWELKLNDTYKDCSVKADEFRDFRESDSDVKRITWCSRLPIWRDGDVCAFVQKCAGDGCRGRRGKSEEQSASWRQKGNTLYRKGQYNEALACYSQSVLIAPSRTRRLGDGSETRPQAAELALAVANRSGALQHLGHYELAVKECDLAVSCGYPSGSLYKVLQRKGQCLLQMDQQEQALEAFRKALLALDEAVSLDPQKKGSLKSELEELIHSCHHSSGRDVQTNANQSLKIEELPEPSDKLAGASRSLSLQCCQDKGRFLVADSPVSAGDLVIKEIPYAAVLLPDYHATHCHYCCRSTLNPIPCPDCADVQYCTDRCLQSARRSHHWLECGLTEGLNSIGPQACLSLRLLLRAKSRCHVRHVARETIAQSCSEAGRGVWPKPEPDPSEVAVRCEADEVQSMEGNSASGPQMESQGAISPREAGQTASPDCGHPGDFDADPQTPSEVSSARDRAVPREVEAAWTRGAPPYGCGRDGAYRCDYRAVYHLMPHTKNHAEQELFNMTMVAVLISKCIQDRLQASPQWTQSAQTCTLNSPPSDAPTMTDYQTGHPSEKNQTTLGITWQNRDAASCDGSAGVPEGCGCRCQPCCSLSDGGSLPVATETAAALLRHLQQLKCNAHAVTAVQTVRDPGVNSGRSCEPAGARLRDTAGNGCPGASGPKADAQVEAGVDGRGNKLAAAAVDMTAQVRLAAAVYPTASLLNHACQPNVIASFDGDVLTMRATRDIHPGEEILHCYGPHVKHMAREDRQRALQEQYFFTCTCQECGLTPADETETCDWSSCYGCSKCGHPLVQRQDKRKVGRCVNPKCRNTQSLRDLSKEKERAANLFKLSQHFMECKHIEECLGLLHQCYKIRREVLYKHHKAVAETQDCLAKCYSLIGDYKQAGRYLRLSVATVEKQYGAESIELANELHKLAQVLFNGGEVQDTLVATEGAIKLLKLHYGPRHHDVQELMQMRTCLLSL